MPGLIDSTTGLGYGTGLQWATALAGATPYLGLAATRNWIPDQINASLTTLMSRSSHTSRGGAIAQLKIVVPHFAVNGSFVEAGPGANGTVTASIEYPAATFTQVKFSGNTSGTVLNNDVLVSDWVTVSIPNNTQFWVRMYVTCASGGVYKGSGYAGSVALGDALNNGGVDQTMSGSVSEGFGGGYTRSPVAIVAMTTAPTVAMYGTSRTAGLSDTYDASGDIGIIARSVGPYWGYINGGIPSDTVPLFIASHTNRLLLANYVSHVICEGPTNNSAGTTNANLLTFWGYFSALGKKVYSTTCDPATSSTDSWATTANQTVTTNYATKNAYILTTPSPLTGSYNLSTATASQVAEKWNATGVANQYTADGIHENQYACLAIQSSGVIPASAYTR